MSIKKRLLNVLFFTFSLATTMFSYASDKPNVIVILTDDQGWADVGFNGATDIKTPNLDALAKHAIVFDQGYVSHPYCSPSRAGLLTGRYQQRFGHENNPPYEHENSKVGLPLSEKTIADEFKLAGYTTAAIGKWHLGDHKRFWPTERGFDYWFGFSMGGMSYWGTQKKKGIDVSAVMENGVVYPKDKLTYITDDFTAAGQRFIKNNKDKPFFMYMAYNAPHGPIFAPDKYLMQNEHIENGPRAAYASLVTGVDVGVGELVKTLKAENIYDNTMIVYLSDNGGHRGGASSAPYRGNKGMLFEGGIRVPFFISWPKKLTKAGRYPYPVTSLDILPTTLAAAGVNITHGKPLDGVNLLPYLMSFELGKSKKQKTSAPHETLYWRYSDGAGYAVRSGKYKLVHSKYKERTFLFDMEKDPLEHYDLALKKPLVLAALKKKFEKWNSQLINGLWPDAHLQNVAKEEKIRQASINKARKGQPESMVIKY